MWYTGYMLAPVTVSVEVPFPRADVYEFLDVMANHEPFTNHALVDWEYSGPDRGVGSQARVKAKAAGRTDTVDIEVVSADAPRQIVERNVGAKGKRVATGTYDLEETLAGTLVSFTYAWQQAPLAERALGPATRAIVRRIDTRAMQRLAEQLPAALARRPG